MSKGQVVEPCMYVICELYITSAYTIPSELATNSNHNETCRGLELSCRRIPRRISNPHALRPRKYRGSAQASLVYPGLVRRSGKIFPLVGMIPPREMSDN